MKNIYNVAKEKQVNTNELLSQGMLTSIVPSKFLLRLHMAGTAVCL